MNRNSLSDRDLRIKSTYYELRIQRMISRNSKFTINISNFQNQYSLKIDRVADRLLPSICGMQYITYVNVDKFSVFIGFIPIHPPPLPSSSSIYFNFFFRKSHHSDSIHLECVLIRSHLKIDLLICSC